MKTKFEISVETGYDETNGRASYKTIKVFKGNRNEANAIAFVSDNKNIAEYGYMTLKKYDQNGARFEWDDNSMEWTL